MGEASVRRRAGMASIPARVAGRYEPLAKIASGGMATVYLARAVTGAGFGKRVALKCVHPHMAEQREFVDMFLDEARIASRIDHPNVCTVFDAGEDDGTHFIAMEYLHGEPLSELVRKWDAAPSERPERFSELAARIVADAAMGLHAAHELKGAGGESLGLVHRDVSPQNLFVTYEGSVKVVDFGVAKAAGRLHETTTGVVKGKLAYMSPEQLQNEPLDRRTDVWALGVTLWESLTCRRLFKRDEQIATLRAVIDGRIPPPSELEPAVPPELERVVMKALARDREARQPTARALADELNAFIAGRGVHVGMAELADLMGSTFADERAKKDAWVARAQENGPPSGPEPDAPAVPVEPTVSEVRPTQLAPTEPVELPMRRTGAFVALGVALAFLVAGAVVGVAVMGGDDAEPPAATGDEATATEEPATTGVAPAADSTGPGDRAGDSRGPISREAPRGAVDPEADPRTAGATSTANAPTVPGTRTPGAPDPRPPTAPRGSGETASRPSAGPTAPAARRDAPREGETSEAPAPPRDVRIVHPGGGWAHLRVDGRPAANTPTTVPALAPGRHVVELQPYGHGDWVRHPTTVPPGAGAHVVRIPLPPPP